MWRSLIGMALVAVIAFRLYQVYRKREARKQEETSALYRGAYEVVKNATLETQGPNEFPRLVGTYEGFSIQIKPVVDTLATRRLPALWLLVTLQDALPVKAHFDLMMRPAGPTTFSNFDHLPDTILAPEGFPEHAVIRSTDEHHVFPAEIIRPYLAIFTQKHAKELLVTENGLRVVWLLAEADRARYGVFRQAEFGMAGIEPDILKEILQTLLGVRRAILDWAKKTT